MTNTDLIEKGALQELTVCDYVQYDVSVLLFIDTRKQQITFFLMKQPWNLDQYYLYIELFSVTKCNRKFILSWRLKVGETLFLFIELFLSCLHVRLNSNVYRFARRMHQSVKLHVVFTDMAKIRTLKYYYNYTTKQSIYLCLHRQNFQGQLKTHKEIGFLYWIPRWSPCKWLNKSYAEMSKW